MSGLLNFNLNSSTLNLPDSSERPFATSFSGQSGSVQGFHLSGLHNIHGNYSLPNIPGSLAQRNAVKSGLPLSGVQQPGGSISGRFASNNLPVAIPHAHSGVSGREMNVGGGQAFSSGMNMGRTIPGLSSNLGTTGNRNSIPGNPTLGPRITNIVHRSNIGRNISSGGLSVPIISSGIDFSGNAASGRLNVQGSNRMMNDLIPQGMPDGAIGLMLKLIYFPKLLQSGMQIYFRELLPKTHPLLFFAPIGQEVRAIVFTGCSLDRFFLWILWVARCSLAVDWKKDCNS